MTSTREKILGLLKAQGPRPAGALAKRLGITSTGVRQHLDALAEEGLVAFEDVAGQVGRPKRIWRTTSRADALFPDSHAELAVGMLKAARAAFGAKGLERIVEERTALQAERYGERMPPPGSPLAERVAALARIRDEEGYLATSGREKDGSLLLVENHCPICVAAKACTGLCAGEQSLFERLLGPRVRVERLEHILSGARRCAYRISKA